MELQPEIVSMDYVLDDAPDDRDDDEIREEEEEGKIVQQSFLHVETADDLHQTSCVAYTSCLLGLGEASLPKVCTMKKKMYAGVLLGDKV